MKLFEEFEDDPVIVDETEKEVYCPFRFFLNSINVTKQNVMGEDSNGKIEEAYNSFIINKTLSYFPDTVMQSNTMNLYHTLDNKLKYDFLLNSIRQRKRFTKWIKSNAEENIETIKIYFNVGDDKASEILSLLDTDKIKKIKELLSKGGRE